MIISAVIATTISTAISSSPVAFAATTSCFYPKGQDKTSFCTISGPSGKWYECTKGADGVRRCVEIKSVIDNSIPPELKDALDIAVEESQENDLKVPRDEFLEGGALSPGNNTDNNDDTKFPEGRGGLDDNDGPTVN